MSQLSLTCQNSLPASLLTSSFFDDCSKIKKIWESAETITKLMPGFDIEKQTKKRLESVFQMRSRKSGKIKDVYIILCDDFLYKQKKNQYGKILYFENVRLIINDGSVKGTYCFQFIKNRVTSDLMTNNEVVFQKFKVLLSVKCILHSFHQDYKVMKMIGKGSFAKVYMVKKFSDNSEYAVKAFNKDSLITQDKGKASIINEISIMRKMAHKSVITLFEVYESEHSLYLILENIQGGELLKAIKQKDFYEEREVKLIMKNLLEALDHIHENQVMHRDLKLENMLLRSEFDFTDLVIVDFGLATPLNIPTSEVLFKRCGTPGFVGPEVLMYKDGSDLFYDEKCDIFSAGVILHILLTGKKPFRGADFKEVLRANRDCKLDYGSELYHGVNQIGKDLLMKLLNPIPENRPSARIALNHKYFENLAYENSNDNLSSDLESESDEELPNSPPKMQLKDFSLAKFPSNLTKSIKDSVDIITADMTMKKPAPKYSLNQNQTVFSIPSNNSIDSNSPRKLPNSKFNKGDLEEEKVEKLPMKRYSDMGPSLMANSKRASNTNELHKIAIKNHMKEKNMNDNEIPDEDSPIKSALTRYGSLEAKTKND